MADARAHRRLLLAGVASTLAFPAGAAREEPRTLRLVAPFPPGGSTDMLARALAERLGPVLGQTAVVENRPGANGGLGAAHVARAPPDGQTLLVTTNASFIINPLLYKSGTDYSRALVPVAQLVELELVLAVRPDLPAGNLREFIALARARPQGLAFASVGAGSLAHLAGEAFRHATGVSMLHVPYKGAAPALADLLGGQVDCYFGTPPTFLQHARAGRLRVLATTALERSVYFEDVPRVADLHPGFEVVGWQGLFMPAATPAQRMAELEREARSALSDPALRARLSEQGMRVSGRGGRELAQIVSRERAYWQGVLARSGIETQ